MTETNAIQKNHKLLWGPQLCEEAAPGERWVVEDNFLQLEHPHAEVFELCETADLCEIRARTLGWRGVGCLFQVDSRRVPNRGEIFPQECIHRTQVRLSFIVWGEQELHGTQGLR